MPVVALLVLLVSIAAAQRPRDQKPPNTTPPQNQAEPPQTEIETIKIDTNLVTVPVIASARSGLYISDLRKEEFTLAEDGVPQQIAFLATVNAPFHLILLLDTSASTEEKIGQIQKAAIAFVEQLSPADKVKVVSFDNQVRDLNEFTSNKAILRGVIQGTRSGTGTRMYDAIQFSLDALRPINQRKAIVVFTDGVDWHSESATFEATIRDLDESGVIVYPIRFETRAEAERIARQQTADEGNVQLPTSSVIRQPGSGTTPTTFPGEDPSPVPSRQRPPLPIPPPSVIFGRGTSAPPNRSPTSDPFPDGSDRDPGTRSPRTRTPGPGPGTTGGGRRDDGLSGMLDNLYLMGDSYLKELADRTGGQVYRADVVAALPQAFAAIAAELRTQYLLGYYPSNRTHDGAYHKIQVKTSRKDIAIRARPGYRAKTGR